MKIDNRGFLLTEALIVITFVSLVLFYLFIQFNNVFDNYEVTFIYNTGSGLYKSNEVKKFLLNNDFGVVINELENDNVYLDLTTCPIVQNTDYCQGLITDLEIEKLYFVKENITTFQSNVENSADFPSGLRTIMRYIIFDREHDGYRLIIKFTNGEYASINFL